MVSPQRIYNFFCEQGVEFFAGVPDSLLKDFCAYIQVHAKQHFITANEGLAVSLAAGYHLATGKIPLVYLQNSGIGNTINPLLSLMDKEVYSLPVVLMIGWRGEPDTKDEPQHKKQGRVQLALLEALEIPYAILDDNESQTLASIEGAIKFCENYHQPFALVVKTNVFEPYKLPKAPPQYEMTREAVLKHLEDSFSVNDVIVSTTGKASREIFDYIVKEKGQSLDNHFLTVGSMGHSSSIAMGIALQQPSKTVYCLDGDGALLMHMGSMALTGTSNLPNYRHILINNGAHESVGGQPTNAFDIDFTKIAKACGYTTVWRTDTLKNLEAGLKKLKKLKGNVFWEIRVQSSSRNDLGRPKTTPIENKQNLMNTLIKHESKAEDILA